MPLVLRLEGPLEVEPLRRTFETIVQRHEALRTTFGSQGGACLSSDPCARGLGVAV